MKRSFPVIKNKASLAPMAGVADSAFRELCRGFGASRTTSEMVSAKALVFQDKKTVQLLEHTEKERPFGIQLFGSEPEIFARAASRVEKEFFPDFIDINMGCPAPKIVNGGAGSALMKSPALALDIVRAVRDSVSVPVTVKLRAGFDSDTADTLAPLLEQAGADALVVHGRTRDRMYKPPVDLEIIKRVKEAVGIPVIGNGDVFSCADALRMLEYTGCDEVMAGRGCLGYPQLFAELEAALSGKPAPTPADIGKRMQTLLSHARLVCERKGEFIGIREIRKHAAWYTKGFRGAAALRADANSLSSLQDLDVFIAKVLELNA